MEINDIIGIIIQESIKIHTDLGPGLLESVYEELLAYRLNKRGLIIKRQTPIPLFYEAIKMDIGFRSDLIVNDKVIVEIKSIETISPVHPKILLTYLKLTGITVGLLINFNEAILKNGIKRIVNNYIPAFSAPQRETKI
jgi:iron complex transport system substrate-binding protein